jgi:hypothetical protein
LLAARTENATLAQAPHLTLGGAGSPPRLGRRRRRYPGADLAFQHFTAYVHAGGYAGNTAYIVRTTAGVSFVVSFATNLAAGVDPVTGTRVRGQGGIKSPWRPRAQEIMRRLSRIPKWPDGDHFGHFGFPAWVEAKGP